MAEHSKPSKQATAVARVLAGESQRGVAADMGISPKTVRRWLREVDDPETPRALGIAEQAHAIAGQIEHWETIARDRLIQRAAELAPESDDLAAVVNAYAKLGDKALLRQGKPTQITKSVDQMDTEIENMLATMAEREMTGSGDGRD